MDLLAPAHPSQKEHQEAAQTTGSWVCWTTWRQNKIEKVLILGPSYFWNPSFFNVVQPAHIGHHYSFIILLLLPPPHCFLLYTPIWFLCSICWLPLSALTSVVRCRIEPRSPLINSSRDRLWKPQVLYVILYILVPYFCCFILLCHHNLKENIVFFIALLLFKIYFI